MGNLLAAETEKAPVELERPRILLQSGKGLKDIPDFQQYDLSIAESLHLDNNQLKNINFSTELITTLKPKLKTLSFYNNKIEEVSESIFEFTNLEKLSMDMNILKDVPKNFSKLVNLQNLSIFMNQLEYMDVVGFKNLLELNLANNDIVSLDVTGLTNLKLLNLTSNKLKELPKGFGTLKSLSYCVLWFNEISNFDIDCTGLESLRYLDISYNYIKKFHESFSKLGKLQDFHASNNLIEEIPMFPLCITDIHMKMNKLKTTKGLYTKEHTTLREIDFSFNEIEEFHQFPYSSVTVNLSHNRIKKIPIEGFQYITTMNLSHNQITEIPSELSTSVYLNKLDLGYNKIKKIPKELILNTKELQHLILSKNEIQEFLKEEKEEMNILQFRRILLAFNQIEKLPEKFFEYVPQLNELDLSWNCLKSLPKSIKKIPKLQFLHLGGNKLSDDSLEVISHIEPNLKQLIISDNMFKKIPKYKQKDLTLRECVQDPNLSKVGEAEMIGKRSSSEDSIVIDEEHSIFAVFDGHGGSNAAKGCSMLLPKMMEENMSLEEPEDSFKKLFSLMEKEVCENVSKNEGTTGTVVLIHGDKVTCANVGDTRSIICSKNCSKQISVEHKPHFRTEHDRIRKVNGYVTRDSRVQGIIAVSRSFGDLGLKDYLSAEPDVFTCKIDKDDEYLVICCDGVWDVLENEEVREIVDPKYTCEQNARRLRDLAFGLGSTDNITSIVVKLK